MSFEGSLWPRAAIELTRAPLSSGHPRAFLLPGGQGFAAALLFFCLPRLELKIAAVALFALGHGARAVPPTRQWHGARQVQKPRLWRREAQEIEFVLRRSAPAPAVGRCISLAIIVNLHSGERSHIAKEGSHVALRSLSPSASGDAWRIQRGTLRQ